VKPKWRLPQFKVSFITFLCDSCKSGATFDVDIGTLLQTD